MKQFSAVWLLYVFLRGMAVCVAVIAAWDMLAVLPPDFVPSTVRLLGVPVAINPVLHMLVTALWILFSGLAASAVLLALSEILRISANAEAFARASYSLSRKRPAAAHRVAVSEETVPIMRRPVPVAAPDFEMREPDLSDLQFSPPDRYRRQQLRAQGAPARRVTVFRGRRDNVVHAPRPAGHVEVVDWLDADSEDFRRIPFDRV